MNIINLISMLLIGLVLGYLAYEPLQKTSFKTYLSKSLAAITAYGFLLGYFSYKVFLALKQKALLLWDFIKSIKKEKEAA